MSSQNEDALENFLTEIADAIRFKDGTSDEIVANTFPRRIREIQGGTMNFTYYRDLNELAGIGYSSTVIDVVNAMVNNSMLVCKLSDGTNSYTNIIPSVNLPLGVFEVFRYNENRTVLRYTAMYSNEASNPAVMWYGETQTNPSTSTLVWSGWHEVATTKRNIIPATSGLDLGSSTDKWQNLYLSGNISDGTNGYTLANLVNAPTILTKTLSSSDFSDYTGSDIFKYKADIVQTIDYSFDTNTEVHFTGDIEELSEYGLVLKSITASGYTILATKPLESATVNVKIVIKAR